jgi:hypothetical protein
VEAQDFETTVREHRRAFEHLQGAAAVCLYDNMKVVVTRWEDDEPIYNRRFLAFATHYGFKPWACKPRRPRTKGKVERPFHYVETNLLNGRDFHSLEHLNEVTAWWLANVADVRTHGELHKRPIDLHETERPHLLPLPDHAYDADSVVYRHVDAEGFIQYESHRYSAPWRYIGAILPLKVGEQEIVLYSPKLEEIARHPRANADRRGDKTEQPSHRPPDDHREQLDTLMTRFREFGPAGVAFLDQLLERSRSGKSQARRILGLLTTYRRQDLELALERAKRFGAFAYSSVERILAVQAKPKPLSETLGDVARQLLDPRLLEECVAPRPTHEYQSLLEEHSPHEEINENPELDGADSQTDPGGLRDTEDPDR